MDSKLSAFADRLKSRLDGAKDLLIPDQELVELVNNDLDKVSGAAAHASGHISCHGSIGREVEDAV